MGFARKGVFEGTVSGRHPSPYRGYSLEFLSFRPYCQGDDIRYLDWKVYGRSERFYVRQFEQETNMRVCVVVDKSNSMDYGKGFQNKILWAKVLASTLIYILIKRGDSVAFASASDRLEIYEPPARAISHLFKLLKVTADVSASGKTDIASALEGLGGKLNRRTAVVLISDLLTETDRILKTVKNFIHQKHNFVVFHILHRDELNLPPAGNFLFVDKETGEKIPIIAAKSAGAYKRDFRKFLLGIENTLTNSGAGYYRFDTSADIGLQIPMGLHRTGFSYL
ncbi:MAG: DUF58 domain-containing protein [Elusimicrobia bacterium]|nr:DUF58 domain-containing protein [Elusimicrobiota bacterium]